MLGAALGALASFQMSAQTTIPVYAADDTCVLSPGAGNTASYWDGADRNFGSMRSRHVSAATAHPGGSASNPSKGEFDAVIRFYPSNAVAQFDAAYGAGCWRVSGLALKLVTSDNVTGPGIFNAPGTAGQYNVSWMTNDGGWVAGNGYINQGTSPHDPAATPDNFAGLTYNGLQAILATNPAVVLNTLSYAKQGTLFSVTNNLTTTNQALLDALANAVPASLLLAAADGQVAFNFSSHLYSDDRNTNVYSPALFLTGSPLAPLRARVETNAAEPYLALAFQRLSGVTNATYVVEAADTLTNLQWTVIAGATNGAPVAGPGFLSETASDIPGVNIVAARDPQPIQAAGARFYRLRTIK